jgi:ribosome biogenesis SPOUT family RNA methylase Rps3
MKTENSENEKVYIIDHQEGGLLEWCQSEYSQIMYYKSASDSKVIITNSQSFNDTNDFDETFRLKVFICNQNLLKEIQDKNQQNKFILCSEGINTLLGNSKETLFLNKIDKSVPFNKICLMDLRAEKELSPSDSEQFSVFIFGGILGDHPPKDRTKYLRDIGFEKRHLGPIQMSTDTALLTTKLIIENKIPIDKIPFIVEPEFHKPGNENTEVNKNSFEESVCMEGFRYISNEINPLTGEITANTNAKPLGHPKIYEDLIFEEFDPSLFI